MNYIVMFKDIPSATLKATITVHNELGQPVSNAKLTLNGNSLYTDVNGLVVFNGLPSNTKIPYTLEKTGYYTSTGQVETLDADVTISLLRLIK